MAKTDYSHILKYTSLFGGVQGLNILISLVRNKLVALILGTQGMGLISLFNSTVTLFSGATNLGIPTSGVRNVSKAYEQGDPRQLSRTVALIRSWSVLTAIVGTLLCMLLSPVLNRITFSWGNHTLHFAVLSPVIGLMAITGGEMAILKGMRRMRRLAQVSIINVVVALVVSVPLYLSQGERGIVPSLVLVALLQMVFTVAYSYRVCPLRLSFSRGMLGEGANMIRLGMAFVFATVLGGGAEFAIRSYFNQVESLDFLGLYNAAYMIVVTYGGMIFAAMETDFFPRLSAIGTDNRLFCQIVNSQIEASLLLICPMLIALSFFMPIIIPLLFTSKFSAIVPMAQVALFGLFFRTLYLPMGYMNLARGRSVPYLLLEALSAVILVAAVIVGYRWSGLMGVGYAIVVAHLLDLLFTGVYVAYAFGFRPSRRVLTYSLFHMFLLAAAFYVIQTQSAYTYWVAAIILLLLSSAVSVFCLLSER